MKPLWITPQQLETAFNYYLKAIIVGTVAGAFAGSLVAGYQFAKREGILFTTMSIPALFTMGGALGMVATAFSPVLVPIYAAKMLMDSTSE